MRQQQQAYTGEPKRPAPQLSEPLWTGRVVRHETFGNGVIVRVRGSDLFIDFPGHGEKWFELEDIGTWIEWVDLPNQAS